MNLIKTTLLFLVLLMVSTFMPYKEYGLNIGQEETISTSSLGTGEAIWNSNDCFDQKMETWFVSFNGYQSMGYDMEKANEMANADVMDEYESCHSDVKVQIASLTEVEQDNL